jgi:hypothetical protein
VRLVRKQRGVNATVDDQRAAFTGGVADLVATQRVTGVNADTDNVAGLDGRRLEHFERLVDDHRIAEARRCSGSQHIQPPRCNHTDAERDMTRID